MPSFIWDRDTQEAYHNPYEYPAQKQFVAEAKRVLDSIHEELCKFTMTYKRGDVSKDKAIWMLLLDAIDSLIDSLELLNAKRHRIAARVFRDVVEECDLAVYFAADSDKSRADLEKWYRNEIIQNSIVRDHFKKHLSPEIAKRKASFYKMMSMITHRTYRTLALGYLLGHDDYLAYDGASDSKLLVTPHTISMYYALIAFMIKMAVDVIVTTKLLPKHVVENIWAHSLDEETVPRRFITPQEVYQRYLEQKAQDDNESDYA